MKIAFLNSIENETFGGMEHWIGHVGRGLSERGHEISVLGRKDSIFLNRVSSLIPTADVVELNISGDFNPFTITAIARVLSNKNIQILNVNFNKDIRLGGLAAKSAGGAKVVWSAGMNLTKRNMVHRWLSPRLVDSILSPSQSLKNELVASGYISPDMVHVVPIGIPDKQPPMPKQEMRRLLRERYHLPQSALVAVTSARFVQHKGHEYLIEAASRLVEAYPDLFFLFLGDGPSRTEYLSKISELGLQQHFRLAGMLDDIDTELFGADLMIHPAKEEPFGIALVEGMRAALPVLASRTGGIPEVLEDGKSGFLFEACNSGAIVDATFKVLGDESLMKKAAEGGRLRFENCYSFEMMIERLEGFYRSLIFMESVADTGK